MGERGPVPKRVAAKRRRNKPEMPIGRVQLSMPGVAAPATPDGLHAIAAAWFESLKASGQARFYEPSDWAAARYVATAMTKTLNTRKFSSQAFAAVFAAMGGLLTTEASRRRVRMEIERLGAEAETPPGIAKIQEYRKRAAAK